MGRKLPAFTIEGTVFEVDVPGNQLCQKDNTENKISFSEMLYQETHYQFEYDVNEKNLPPLFDYYNRELKRVTIPSLVELDPDGMSLRYGIAVSNLSNKTDFDIIVSDELLQQRLKGVLPVVDIAGHDFIVDYRMRELRPKDDVSTSITMNDLDYFFEEKLFRCFYHPASHQVVPVNSATITHIPEGLVMLEIPLLRKLDPVGYAREAREEVKTVAIKYPPQRKAVIPVIPIEQTNLPKTARRNAAVIAAQQNKKQHTAINSKKGRRIE